MAPNRNILNAPIDPFADDVPARQIDAPPRRTMEDVARHNAGVDRPATPRGLAPRPQQAPDRYTPQILPDGTHVYAGYRMTKTGLIPPADGTEKDWFLVGDYLFSLESEIQWWIGDFLDQGDRVWKHTVQQVADGLGRDAGTLYNWTTVCRKFQISRRREKLSFTHHVEVAGLTEDEQDYWLDQAAAGERPWSTRALRAAINEGVAPAAGKKTWLDTLQSKLFGNRKKYAKVQYVELAQAAELMRAELMALEDEMARRRASE